MTNPIMPAHDKHSAKPDISDMSEVVEFSKQDLEALKLIHAGSDNQELLKSFRELRTRLFTRMKGENFVCLVTSVAPQGGGSYVARNLGSAITMDKTRTVLLVDANLYSPSVSKLLPVDAMLGLTDFLDDDTVSIEEIVYASGVPRLRVISVGNNCDGGTEKIMSQRMKLFIDEVKGRYRDRIVIIDAPSVGEYDAETRILADFCDFVILVVPDNRVTDTELKKAIQTIGRERIAGLVLDKADI